MMTKNFLDSLYSKITKIRLPLSEFLTHLRSRSENPHPPTEEPPAPVAEPPLLHIRSREDLEDLLNRLLAMDNLRAAAEAMPDEIYLNSVNVYNTHVEKACAKICRDVDENTSANLASLIIRLVDRLFPLLKNCIEHKDSAEHAKLEEAIEAYFHAIGITRTFFRENDHMDDWLELQMPQSTFYEPTSDESKIKRIYRIFVQPHALRYMDANGEHETRHFGGSCVIYKRALG